MVTTPMHRSQYARVRVDSMAERRRLSAMAWVSLIVLVPMFAIALAYVRLTSEQQTLKRHLSELRRQLGEKGLERHNLELEVEMYRTGTRILGQVQRLNLGLQMPQPGQVTRVRNGAPMPTAGARSEAVLAER